MNFDRLSWPKEVSILDVPYTVLVVDEIDEDNSRGETLLEERVIKVRKEPKKIMWSTLFHEMAHAWLEESQFTAYLTDDKVEEMLVCMIEKQFLPAIFQVIKRK